MDLSSFAIQKGGEVPNGITYAGSYYMAKHNDPYNPQHTTYDKLVEPIAKEDLPSLKEAYAGKFDFGAAVPQYAFSNPKLKELILKEKRSERVLKVRSVKFFKQFVILGFEGLNRMDGMEQIFNNYEWA